MEKTLEQIVAEAGKIPPAQTMKDLRELKEKLGVEEFEKEYLRVAMKNAERRWTR